VKGKPDPYVFAVITLGVIVMRAAGCVINDYADRHFDPYVERTKQRPIAAGLIKPRESINFFCRLMCISICIGLNTQ
jgi:4-hydroxybenzoate polyprenyltransferase